MVRITALLLILAVSMTLVTGCGEGESKEDIALEVAREWVDDSIGEVSDTVIEVVVGDVPVLSQIAGDVLEEQLRENISWTFSTPRSEDDDAYLVTATAAVNLSIDIPLLGEKAYTVSLPFELEVDTDTRVVSGWLPDVDSARVEEK